MERAKDIEDAYMKLVVLYDAVIIDLRNKGGGNQ